MVAAESEMKPAAAGGKAAMIGRRMARGRRVGVMQESRSEQAMTAGVDRWAGRRANGGGEGPPHDARSPCRGDRRADARTTREAAESGRPTGRRADEA